MLMELVPGVHMQYCCLVHGYVSVRNCLHAHAMMMQEHTN